MKGMLKGVLRVLTVSGAMLMLSLAVAAAAVYFGGIVNDEQVRDIARVVEGKLASPKEEPAAEVQKTEAELKSEADLTAAVAQWKTERASQEQALESEKAAVEDMRRELESVRGELVVREEAFRKERAAYEVAKAAEEAAAQDAGFQEAVKRYAAMEAADVAELLYGLDDDTVLRYLKAFRTDKAAEVLTEVMKIDAKAHGGGAINRAAVLQEMMSGGPAEAAAGAAVSAAN